MHCKVKVDEQVQKEVNFATQIMSIISLAIGSVGLILYIILCVALGSIKILTLLLGISTFFFVFGLIMLITVAKANARGVAQNVTDEYNLNDEFVEVKSLRNEEIVAMQKTYYNELVKFKETKNYYILYPTTTQAYVIPKTSFTPEELSELKSWIKKANPRIVK